MIRTLVLLALPLGALAACSPPESPLGAEYTPFKAKLSSSRADRRSFTVTLSNAGLGVEQALEAGRYRATQYCVRNWGGSQVEWAVGPDTPVDELTVVDGKLVLSGSCSIR